MSPKQKKRPDDYHDLDEYVDDSMVQVAEDYRGLLHREGFEDVERFMLERFIELLRQGRRHVTLLCLELYADRASSAESKLFRKNSKLMEPNYRVGEAIIALRDKHLLLQTGKRKSHKRVHIGKTIKAFEDRIAALVPVRESTEYQLELEFAS